MGSAAEHRALHPPLRQFLEDRLGGFAIDEPTCERHDTPVEIEGRLMSDAFATDAGASMRVRVERVSVGACLEPAAGGVSLTVIGALDGGRRWASGAPAGPFARWRCCGRPASYLNDGVPDQERLMARRGIALVGSVKSAALVQVVTRGSWIDETAAAMRAGVRRAIDRHVGARDPQSAAIAVAILIGDRGALDPLVEQRLQEAGTYHVIAISGGNIAILAGLVLGLLWAHRRARRLGGGRGDRAAGRLRLPGRRRAVGDPRHGNGGHLSGAADDRSADGAADMRSSVTVVAVLLASPLVDRRRRTVADLRRHGGDCRRAPRTVRLPRLGWLQGAGGVAAGVAAGGDRADADRGASSFSASRSPGWR